MRADKGAIPPDTAPVRSQYLRWFRSHAFVLTVPLVAVAWGQFAIVSLPDWPPPPEGLRSLVLALAAGSIVFGRALKKREVSSSSSGGDALAQVRRISRDLALAAVAPSVAGAILVPMTRSWLDLYLTLGFSLIGCATMFPRASDWARWLRSGCDAGGDA